MALAFFTLKMGVSEYDMASILDSSEAAPEHGMLTDVKPQQPHKHSWWIPEHEIRWTDSSNCISAFEKLPCLAEVGLMADIQPNSSLALRLWVFSRGLKSRRFNFGRA